MVNDVVYGVPEQKKFPLPDADHVKSAIRFFNYVEPKYEKQLANEILKRAKIYGVDLTKMNIGDNNRFKGYLPVNELQHSAINKDFYNNLPGMVCVMCDHLVKKYGKEDWFPKAWEEYRHHVKTQDIDHMKMPGFVFNKYVKETEMKHSATSDGQYYWIDEDELMHSRKGWTKKNHKYINKVNKNGKVRYIYTNNSGSSNKDDNYSLFELLLGQDKADAFFEAYANKSYNSFVNPKNGYEQDINKALNASTFNKFLEYKNTPIYKIKKAFNSLDEVTKKYKNEEKLND